MESFYISEIGQVKARSAAAGSEAALRRAQPPRAGYAIHLYGRIWRIRATHLELLSFLRRLCASRSAA